MSAAAAVAEAAGDGHGRQRPRALAGAAGEAGHRGREHRQGGGRQELAAHVDPLGAGVALEEPLDVLEVGAGAGEGGVGQAQAGGQASDEAGPGQHATKRARVVNLAVVATAILRSYDVARTCRVAPVAATGRGVLGTSQETGDWWRPVERGEGDAARTVLSRGWDQRNLRAG